MWILKKKHLLIIRLNFFSEFGENNELLENRNAFFTGKDAYLEKIKEKEREIRKNLKDKKIPVYDQVMFQKEMLGYSDIKYPELKDD